MNTAARSHHTAEGFRNNHPIGVRGSYWRWQRERWANGLPRTPPGGYRFETARPDVRWLRTNRSTGALTWIGHATFLLQLAGVNLLTDPHLTARASPLAFAGPRRLVPPALSLHEVPHIDVVLVSHNHYDHLDMASVKHLSRQAGGSPLFLVPLGLKKWFAGRGIANVIELDWWEASAQRGLSLHCLPVQHWSGRTLRDRDRTLWCGWMVESADFRYFFAGDTGYSPDFLDIAARFPSIDLAALPIGAYAPRWFMRAMHVNPEEAVQIHLDLGTRHSVAMHWGTFVLSDEPMDEPPQRLASARRAAGVSSEAFFVMRHGETRLLANLQREPRRLQQSPRSSDAGHAAIGPDAGEGR